jgi:hypothetical protein
VYVKFQLNMYNHWGDNERKLKISDFFQSSRGIQCTSVSYHQTMTKFKLDQCILMTYPYMTCVFLWHIHMLNLSWICITVVEIMNRNWKFPFLQSERGITLPKIIKPWPNSNLTCTFLWRIHMLNLSLMCNTVGEIMNRNWKFHIIFKVKGAQLCQKSSNRDQIQTLKMPSINDRIFDCVWTSINLT